MKRIITAESVNIGHPDKTCDYIADCFLDAALEQDACAQMAVECAIKSDHLFIYGEATTTAKIDYEKIAKQALREIGYTCEFKITRVITEQSPEINRATVKKNILTANDQGFVYGYAVNETPEYMPLPITIAHELMKRYEKFRKKYNSPSPVFFADAKCQVSVEYDGKKPVRIHTILVSVSHSENITHAQIVDVITKNVIRDFADKQGEIPPEIIINPSGAFTIWGSFSDSGCVGRKIVVDTYGGVGRVGGGCFSSKNATKVDRSAAYYARWVAKNIVARGMADECEIQVSYAIGQSDPISINIDTFGTHKVAMEKIQQFVESFDFTPSSIIKQLDLNRPIYKNTACFGHFGRAEFPWERILG